MIPNRDSIPQNQPRPKDAVLKTDGAAASMGGICRDSVSVLNARFMESSAAFEAWLAWLVIFGKPPSIKDMTPDKNKQPKI